MAEKTLVQVRDLKKYFPTSDKKKFVKAVDGVSFDIYRGETLGIVGESGCGKSTTGRLVLKLLPKTEGTITFDGKDLDTLKEKELRAMRRHMQFIFQDPYQSLDPRKTVFQILAEPFQLHYPSMSREDMRKEVLHLLDCVGMREEALLRYPHEFSGGQRQRVCIARALALKPQFIICDEPVSALDVSIQAQIINLMQDLKKEFNLTYMFISHDLGVVQHICDRVAVMYLGNIVEIGPKEAIYARTYHPYTQALISAIPVIRTPGSEAGKRIILQGDLPSPVNPPSGCPFHPRCSKCMDVCKKVKPQLTQMDDGVQVACHLYDQK
ncbi:MAG: dipeptide ABC transporter ATP-binding protein [Eubacteriales bacterium]|nr:dipeptide ABC transporter ATP-binding protein [Eubacteriales bacterium]